MGLRTNTIDDIFAGVASINAASWSQFNWVGYTLNPEMNIPANTANNWLSSRGGNPAPAFKATHTTRDGSYSEISASSSEIIMGDYVWINSQKGTSASSDAHGLLVVGWQEGIGCQIALDTVTTTLTFYSTASQASINNIINPIPYVVDFNRLQRPSARPFYCTAYPDPSGRVASNENFFNPHDWYFYSMPDSIQITLSQFYVSPNWQWQ
jgi:hypothetical protein